MNRPSMRGGGNRADHRGHFRDGGRPSASHNTYTKRNPSHDNNLPPIDREKVCPLLLRVFCKTGSHHRAEEFEDDFDQAEPKDEVQMYTWQDATLRELCDLVKEVYEPARRASARLSFALIYPDSRGKRVLRQVGLLHSTRNGQDDKIALRDVNFETGDFLSVAVY